MTVQTFSYHPDFKTSPETGSQVINPGRNEVQVDFFGYFTGPEYSGNKPTYRLQGAVYGCQDHPTDWCGVSSACEGFSKRPNILYSPVFALEGMTDALGKTTKFEYESNTGVGLRIKNISIFEGSTLKDKIVYTYSAGQGYRVPLYSYTDADGTIIRSSTSYNAIFDLNGVAIGYSTVTETRLDGSKIIRQFTNFSDYPDDAPVVWKYSGNPTTPAYQGDQELARYRKYFKKDSTRYARRMERHWKAQADSLNNVLVAQAKAAEKGEQVSRTKLVHRISEQASRRAERKKVDDYMRRIEQSGFNMSPMFQIMIRNYLEDYVKSIARDDSTLLALGQKTPEVPIPTSLTSKLSTLGDGGSALQGKLKGSLGNVDGFEQASSVAGKANQYASDIGRYSDINAASGVIEEKGKSYANDYLSHAGGAFKEQLGRGDELKAMPGQYKAQAEQLQDSAYLAEQARKKAEEKAMEYLAQNPGVMRGVQQKMSLLMKKYSVVPNSNDLSTAVKRSSMANRTFSERLQFAANFQVISLKPVSIDLSPQVGYKINRYFVAGVGGLYRKTFKKDSTSVIAPDVFGYKAYTSYEVLHNMFAYGEYGRNSPGVTVMEGVSRRKWENVLIVGAGKRFMITPKLETTLMLGYNFMHTSGDTVYPKPWVIRVGFQTSELAMIKRGR